MKAFVMRKDAESEGIPATKGIWVNKFMFLANKIGTDPFVRTAIVNNGRVLPLFCMLIHIIFIYHSYSSSIFHILIISRDCHTYCHFQNLQEEGGT